MSLAEICDLSSQLSTNITTYIVFISLIFLVCFLFLGFQLLNMFKSLLNKMLNDIYLKLDKIDREVKDIKIQMNRRR